MKLTEKSPQASLIDYHTVRIAARSKKRKTSKFNSVLESSRRTDEHSPMVRAGDPAPRTLIESAASPSRTSLRLDDPAPSVVRLDGNFARRRFSPATTDRVFVDSELPGFGLRVRKGGGIGTWFVMVHRRGGGRG